MKKTLFALLASTALLAGPALAEESATPAPAPIEQTAAAPVEAPAMTPVRAVRAGQTIYGADGVSLGRVDRATERSAFVAASGGRLVPVPLTSIFRQEGRLVTTLTREQVFASN